MRRLWCVTLLFVAACVRSPLAPLPESPPPAPAAFADFSGYWNGTFHYTGCSTPKCWVMERDSPFSLSLRQTAGHVVGLFAMPAGNVQVSGDVQADGSLTLEGSESTGGAKGVPGVATFKATALRLHPANGLQGPMRFDTRTFLTGLDTASFYADGAIVSATHQGLDDVLADVSGTWKGLYLVQQCTDDGGQPYCGAFRPNEVEYLELTVSIAGASASGELIPVATRIPVAGVTHGRTLELSGTRENGGVRVTERIEGFAASVDEFGRLQGTFHYARSANGVLSTADVQLLQVVKGF